ncbi:Nop domain-containing protein [Parathielavia hyrcaniae]|uniref:Nucleolar protein 58 n=1 Tax=Parathielavia hyrcaniae TaxID=113614 RepID=A0AAN6T2U6_9PEZI|nr:Nop domain-containing protein [Parathielavia hyrcaniae]
MPLFILTETSAGYGLFKAADKKLLDSDNLSERLSTVDKIVKEIKYKEFAKFDSAASALEEIAGVIEGKVTPRLASLLNEFKDEKKVTLAVAESKLGSAILKLPELNIKPISDSTTTDLFRAIRQHLPELIPGMLPENFKEMSLGLSHSLSRHKLKFSPDKVDVMIVHAVSLLDDLDKELNTYAMRVKEWYGWHFPELAKILPDNLSYAKVIVTLGMRSNATESDLSEILPHEIETAVKAAADISMGTEITDEDLENIKLLAEQVISYSEYRRQLAEYLENRMKAISPNMTELVGALVGARLIAHAGSLISLAKNPGSTIQILGAEKALFRALKTKHATPKYGLIYHASLVGQASGTNKGKIARQLAAKIALGVRTDALAEFDDDADDETRAALGIRSKAKLEHNLRLLEGKPLSKGVSVGPNGIPLGAPSKWDIKEARKYNIDADGLDGAEAPAAKRPLIEEVDEEMAELDVNGKSDEEIDEAPSKKGKKDKKEKKEKKDKSKKSKEVEAPTPARITEKDYERLAGKAGMSLSKFTRKLEKGQIKINADGTVEVVSKKDSKAQEADETAAETPVKPKSSKRKHEAEEEAETPAKEEKPKKKKKHSKE